MVLEIREHDVQVSIDDYGTGFSSLAYLRDLPVQEIKMDRSFVGTILSDARSRVIVSSTKQMAHAMGLRMVAEGSRTPRPLPSSRRWASTSCRASTSRGR